MSKLLRNQRVVVMVSSDEAEELQRLVERHPTARTLSDYIRERALGATKPDLYDRPDWRAHDEWIEAQVAHAPHSRGTALVNVNDTMAAATRVAKAVLRSDDPTVIVKVCELMLAEHNRIETDTSK